MVGIFLRKEVFGDLGGVDEWCHGCCGRSCCGTPSRPDHAVVWWWTMLYRNVDHGPAVVDSCLAMLLEAGGWIEKRAKKTNK
jgi:hypothetical protein